MAKGKTSATQQYFQKVLSNFGTSTTASRILEDEVTTDLDQVLRVIKEWLQQFMRTKEEHKQCVPVDRFIYPFEFQQAFKTVKEKTSLSPSGTHYTFWECMALDEKMSDYLSAMMRLPFVYGFVNDRWARCLDVMLERERGNSTNPPAMNNWTGGGRFQHGTEDIFAKQMVANSKKTTVT